MNDAPASSLNPGPTDDRSYGRTRLPLADVQRIRKAAGTTLSDVLLAVVAGALRAHLLARGELPDKALVVNVPVADEDPGTPDPDAGPRQWGNRFANYFSFLATDVEGPAERLAAVAARNAEAKLQLEIQGTRTLSSWLDRIPPAVAEPAARGLKRRTERLRDRPDFNVLVSNVRVPNPTWRVGSQRVEEMYMSGPVADESGLNVTLVGYGDQLHVSLATNPLALERPAELAALLHAEVQALLAAVTSPASSTTSRAQPSDEDRGAPALG
ncbi:WSD1 family O-acyltransferase [Aquihabitans sp. G128]|uniref:WS/DGAT domain-containing protein n=1 Tax=Aquihabitans sp. G128 TaxID=2849779 RepID=UPI001C23A80E|nr:WS/DGAT domain-containing protein [Aquihabitans sp. G128]QXC59430.1 WSD1 family O-acyltransferase [Aquihabitans sp. G128]